MPYESSERALFQEPKQTECKDINYFGGEGGILALFVSVARTVHPTVGFTAALPAGGGVTGMQVELLLEGGLLAPVGQGPCTQHCDISALGKVSHASRRIDRIGPSALV